MRNIFVKTTRARLFTVLLLTVTAVDDLFCAVEPKGMAAGPQQLPDWFLENRIQAHTRLGLKWHDHPVFFTAGDVFSAMGVRVYTRHFKTADEGAWWPSRSGSVHPKCRRQNCAAEIIKDAHDSGCRIIAYYRHMEDKTMAARHPDWLCRDENGQPYSTKRGRYLCFNSPYREFTAARLTELAQMGADGFYFDETHMPKSGCWCRFCREKFHAATGLDHPEKPDHNDAVWRRLVDFNNQTVNETFSRWREKLESINRDIILIIGSNRWPALTDRHLESALFLHAGSVKTEFELAARPGRKNEVIYPALKMPKTVKLAMGYILCRDAAGGRPAHVWVPGITSPKTARLACAGVLAFGNIANLDIRETELPRAGFAQVFQFGETVSRALKDTRPLKEVVILYSEGARNAFPNPAQAVRQVLRPMGRLFEDLHTHHYPVGFVTDATLKDGLIGCKVLWVPEMSGLTQRQRNVIRAFEKAGGIVLDYTHFENPATDEIRTARPQRTPDDENFKKSQNKTDLHRQLEQAGYSPPFTVTGDGRFYTCAFTHPETGALTVCLVNDFGVIRTARNQRGKPVRFPAPCAGLTLIINGRATGRIHDVLNQKNLEASHRNGRTCIHIPDFQNMAVIKIETRP